MNWGLLFLSLILLLDGTSFGQGMILAEQLCKLPSQKSTFTLVDVRTQDDFQKRHIDGAINIPKDKLSEVSLPKDAALVLYCGDARCPLSHEAAKLLAGKGYSDIKILYGGIAEWRKKGYPVIAHDAGPSDETKGASSPAELTSKELWERLQRHERASILDLRPVQEFIAGHLPGARNTPLEGLVGSLAALPKDADIVVYDRVPERSRKAAEQLASAGFAARTLSGGIPAWSMMGYPLETGTRNGP